MNINSEILEFNPQSGSILVKYYSNELPNGMIYNIDLPITNGSYPDETAIISLIDQYAPKFQMERAVLLPTVTVPDYLQAKIPVPDLTQITTTIPT